LIIEDGCSLGFSCFNGCAAVGNSGLVVEIDEPGFNILVAVAA